MVAIMISIFLGGFLTGLLLQIAIGPVFFFILNIALQKTVIDGLFAVMAVTIADYLFIALAVLGVGKLLEKPNIKLGLGITSSVVLMLFGIIMIISIGQGSPVSSPNQPLDANYAASFISTFLLTISSPLTIVFWTGLFAARAIEKGYTQKQLLFFGLGAGLATFVFLGASVVLLAAISASIPMALLRLLNTGVGVLLMVYGIIRLYKLVYTPTGISS
jgi:threonine/homoserine/homoserine lactone efflux protein